MPLMQTSGNVTADAYAGGVAVKPKYIEEYFSTWLRTGTGASATITTGLDASTNKALVWTKSRSAATDHKLTDTVRGATKALISDTTGAQTTDTNGLTAFSSTGYTIGTDTNYNNSGATYVDWEFAATPKFFDVVTFTSTSSTNQRVSHSLGSVPGCIFVKATSGGSAWYTYHTALGRNKYLQLQDTTAANTETNFWGTSDPTSTDFGINGNSAFLPGTSCVAYIFAHNAGGFGLTGTDNVISCGSFTSTGSALSVNLGYEPQWLLFKPSSGNGDWNLVDNMRGFQVDRSGATVGLQPNLTAAESALGLVGPTSTGFTFDNGGSGVTYIYIAIRRGPMKVPTDATKVFAPVTYAGDGTNGTRTITTNFPVDSAFSLNRTGATGKASWNRLIGNGQMLITNTTAAQVDQGNTGAAFGSNTGLIVGGRIELNYSGYDYVLEAFQRAPSFFDEVCYTGTGSAITIPHNLAAIPELIIWKCRSVADNWQVFAAQNGFGTLNNTTAWGGTGNGSGTNTIWQATSTTVALDSTFAPSFAKNGRTYVLYMFATCAGVSKVGTYTGTGATQTISCGFTGGARFVLIKRTDSTGDWYVWDTARGMVSGTDPSLLLNSTAAEVNANSIYTTTGGFQIVSTAAGINASGGSYIFFAVA